MTVPKSTYAAVEPAYPPFMGIDKNGKSVNASKGVQGFHETKRSEPTAGLTSGTDPATERRVVSLGYLDTRLEETFGQFYNQTPGADPTDRDRGERHALETLRGEIEPVWGSPEFALGRLKFLASDDYKTQRTSGGQSDIDDDEFVAGMKAVHTEFTAFCRDHDLIDPPKPLIENPAVHEFNDPEFAYAETQTRDDIKDGDLLVIKNHDGTSTVGFLCEAWPIAVHGPTGGLHSFKNDDREAFLAEKPEYARVLDEVDRLNNGI
ncbi:hypothetical protein [Aeromicrobium sp. 179-A 4D2 NHS]|uniref:hypothetical protein n=1 Tax=Aeromicrobium sp. 179-A 4D2 NHS TaxID=3142375 RepID=UPI0039A027BD